jgi:glycosyltransferase involved in cell wall biosynthesis
MKIAFLANGNSVYDHRFLLKMVERGHQPTLVSYWPHRIDADFGNLPVVHYDPRLPALFGPRVGWYVRIAMVTAHLRWTLRKIRPDILHTNWVQSNGLYGLLSGFHPVLSMPWGSDILIRPEHSRRDKLIAQLVIRDADMVTCDCDLVKQRIIELAGIPGGRVTVFPWGVDLSVFRPDNTRQKMLDQLGWTDKKIIIMTRNFTKELYGHEYLLRAVPDILGQVPDARVVFIGAGPLLDKYGVVVDDLRLREHVFFAGSVTETMMANWLNAADVYVSTSLSDGSSASLMEAMACGVPVVVSDAPANLEWVEDGVNGFIVTRKDSVALAQRLVAILEDESSAVKMGERNREIAQQRADWNKNFDRLEQTYHKLVNRQKRR